MGALVESRERVGKEVVGLGFFRELNCLLELVVIVRVEHNGIDLGARAKEVEGRHVEVIGLEEKWTAENCARSARSAGKCATARQAETRLRRRANQNKTNQISSQPVVNE